jgi:hypothetical protein
LAVIGPGQFGQLAGATLLTQILQGDSEWLVTTWILRN